MKKLALIALCCALLLAGCAREEATPAAAPTPAPGVYALIVKDTSNPYMQYMYQGFQEACAEIGATPLLAGSNSSEAESQIREVEALIEKKVDAIAIAANDSDALSDVLQRALEKGIKVISVDSSVHPADRILHIQQALPERIGRVLIQAACEMVGGTGKAAILSTTKSMPNQALWVSWMETELSDHPDKYADFEVVSIAYGLDEYEASVSASEALIEANPDLDIIISPTVVGIQAASDVVAARGRSIKVTGLGLPGAMAEYIRSGICPWMYLWNPIDVGYIAAHAAHALVTGQATGVAGESLSVGSFGEKKIEENSDGGLEIVVGNPYKFDAGNIAIWEVLF